MALKLANFFKTTLAEDAQASDTQLTLTSTSGLPQILQGDWCYLVITRDLDGLREIVKVTGVSGNTISVVRGQENTEPLHLYAGDDVRLAVTAQTIYDLGQYVVLDIDIEQSQYVAQITFQASSSEFFLLRVWLVDEATPTTNHSLVPPSGNGRVQWELVTDSTGKAQLDLTHTEDEHTWYVCAECCGKVYIAGPITLGE